MPRKKSTSRYNEKQILSAYASFFRTDMGQIVLWDLRQKFAERTSLAPDGNTAMTMANEGKRFVVLYIISQIELGEGAIDGIIDAGPAKPEPNAEQRSDTTFNPLE